jgi:hypothetical protein
MSGIIAKCAANANRRDCRQRQSVGKTKGMASNHPRDDAEIWMKRLAAGVHVRGT